MVSRQGEILALASRRNAIPGDQGGRRTPWTHPRYRLFAECRATRTGRFLSSVTDGLSESTNDAGSELGYHGILGLTESLLLQTGTSSSAMGQALLSAVRNFRGRSPVLDDESMVVLQQTMDNKAPYASQSIASELRAYEDWART